MDKQSIKWNLEWVKECYTDYKRFLKNEDEDIAWANKMIIYYKGNKEIVLQWKKTLNIMLQVREKTIQDLNQYKSIGKRLSTLLKNAKTEESQSSQQG